MKNPKLYQLVFHKQFIFLVAVFLLAASCKNKGDKNSMAAAADQPKDYTVLELSPRKAVLNTDFPASIQGQQNIEIRPKIDGYVEKIYVDEGSIVKKGQLLFSISAPQYEEDVRTAEAGILTAQADVSSAKMEVEKVKPLVDKNIISHYELESAQYTLQSKQALLSQAKATLSNARINLGYTRISSPVSGIIGSLPYKLGSLVSGTTTDPLTTVYNTGNVFAYFSVNEKQLLNFTRNSKGNTFEEKIQSMPKVSLLLSDGSKYAYEGKIETVNGLINSATGSADTRAVFINPKGLIRSGSSATVRIPLTLDSAILVPQSATYELQDKRFVNVLDKGNKVKSVAIEVMQNTPGQFYVVQTGLSKGDKIILEGAGTLKEGTQVKPKEADENSIYQDLK
ncbi:efflux RND transporter periplasmic adaptor subunit [Mucilaginibacter arboris]|uniref:Efflux RND transporter periplasmic adaptor subunit n=1 Tax=Mucilaginibacter arboris TaxID=2682090 RepID=A0A7K1SYY4_9SPHI|nr:efflux RND transporter periplasmic adaptor subunit [Mucilaginibacter arboris]MVN22525.1 efflux RND transporter periplasmic adaptor subunit [Mucilaginibacter arboris]